MNHKEKRVIMLLNAAIAIAAAALALNLFWSLKDESSGLADRMAAVEETEKSEKTETKSDSASDQKGTGETSTENDSRVKTQEEIKELMEGRSSKLFPDINQRYLENEEAKMLKTYEQAQYAIDELYALNGRTLWRIIL